MNMDFVTMNLVTLLYLVASICFIQALKGLSHPTTSIRGNIFGMLGMTIAVITTAALILKLSGSAMGMGWVLAGLVIGGGAGTVMAQRVEMTKMPELVAFMHSMIGLAAVFIAIAAVVEPSAFGIVAQGLGTLDIPKGNRLELFLGAAIGAITFSGSVIAFGKLSGKYKFRLFQGAPVVFAGQHKLNLILGLSTLGLGLLYTFTQDSAAFYAMLALSFVMGVLIIIPIGGADMPVVVSMLNSYSGWAAAATGFMLSNDLLIVTGALVGSSGAILSYIMCNAMNRNFISVIAGGFGGGGENHHELSHHGGDAGMLKKLAEIDRFHLTKLGRFMGMLKATGEDEGSVLDRTAIMFGSGMNSGAGGEHSPRNLPLLVAGGGKLGLKLGKHLAHDPAKAPPLSNVLLSLARATGADLAKFSDSTGPLAGLV